MTEKGTSRQIVAGQPAHSARPWTRARRVCRSCLSASLGTRTWSGLWATIYFFLWLPFTEYCRATETSGQEFGFKTAFSHVGFVSVGVTCAIIGVICAPILLCIMLQSSGVQFAALCEIRTPSSDPRALA